MISWLKGLSITSLVICGLAIIGLVNDSSNFGATFIVLVVFVPQAILALQLIKKLEVK